MSGPVFFPTPADFRAWLAANHGTEELLWVGYYKKATGRPSITWEESVEEALCFGWIDGLRRSIDDEAYQIRFTPRRPRSIWSAKNVATIERLIAEGRMAPAGLEAWEARDPGKVQRYSFEQEQPAFDEEQEARFRADTEAWAFWLEQPAGYRKQATWWVVSAKRADTRARRLETLITDSAAGVRIKQLRR